MFGKSGFAGGGGGDLEAGAALFPGLDATDNVLRWQFVQKVYGIVAAQLALTTLVALAIALNPPVQAYLTAGVGPQLFLLLASVLGLIPLYHYRDRHPVNLALLAAWTAVFAATLGLACSFYAPAVVIQAVFLTAAMVGGLTAYAFAATRRGADFTAWAPMLYAGVWGMLAWGLVQLVFAPGPLGTTIYALLGALLFGAYIVMDTHLLAARYSVDEYIWAAIALYLDIANLFLYLLRLLGQANRQE